jgi:mannose-1-phosphate guanylyltransferase
VAGEPLARRILRWLSGVGVTDAVLNLHHLPHTLTALVGDGADLGVRVRYSWELPVLGSAGGPRRALPLLGAPEFLITNGDTLTDVDVRALVNAHRASGAVVTMAVVPNTQPDKYSGVLVSEEGVVTGFARRGSGQASFHFVGVQVARGEAFAHLPDGVPTESVGSVYPALIADRPGAIRAHVTSAEFFDIGTPADYLETSLILADRAGDRATLIGARARVESGARVESSVVWDDVRVGAGALVRESIVTDGAVIPDDTSWIGVTIRRADGELAPGERRLGDLAIAALA